MLFYLACQEDLVGRADLILMFWPDAAEEDGRRLLREGYSANVMRAIYLRESLSYGLLDRIFLGYPLHFDWTKYTDFATTSPGWDFNFWLGYDF